MGDRAASLPGEQPDNASSEAASRLPCTEFFDTDWFTWTHLPTLILASASVERSLTDTWTWWRDELGPVG